jgi:hypothetical protein
LNIIKRRTKRIQWKSANPGAGLPVGFSYVFVPNTIQFLDDTGGTQVSVTLLTTNPDVFGNLNFDISDSNITPFSATQITPNSWTISFEVVTSHGTFPELPATVQVNDTFGTFSNILTLDYPVCTGTVSPFSLTNLATPLSPVNCNVGAIAGISTVNGGGTLTPTPTLTLTGFNSFYACTLPMMSLPSWVLSFNNPMQYNGIVGVKGLSSGNITFQANPSGTANRTGNILVVDPILGSYNFPITQLPHS